MLRTATFCIDRNKHASASNARNGVRFRNTLPNSDQHTASLPRHAQPNALKTLGVRSLTPKLKLRIWWKSTQPYMCLFVVDSY